MAKPVEARPRRGLKPGHARPAQPTRRRWPRRIAVVLGVLLVVALLLYGWAWLWLDRSAVARALVWMDADVGDQYRFPARLIAAGDEVSPLPRGGQIIDLPHVRLDTGEAVEFDEFLRRSDTRAFLVVDQDRLVYERYFGGADSRSLQTSFSVAKSVLSTLVGIAIEEGLIGSVEDPVTDYLPELAERDARFERITLRHLLTMSSGIRYWEPALPVPFGDDVSTYYDPDMRQLALVGTRIEGPPGQEWHYNNYHPLLLGLVLERTTGMSVSEYMSARLWRPLGAEADATWNLDSERSGFEKLESGLNASPADYARFGLLFLHGGEWSGARIVSEEWVGAATANDTSTDPADHYQYFWWVDVERPGRFYALGNFGQYIYVAPDAGVVIVRNGSDWGTENDAWLRIFRDIADRLVTQP
jgi:CubicO group peptidase (beta-lactamase class C family)